MIVYKLRATTLLSDLKGTREGVAVLLSSQLTPWWPSADQIWNLRSWNFFGLNSASKTLIFSVGFVTGRLIMTVFPLLIFFSTLDWFLIKFVNLSFPNSTASLCWVARFPNSRLCRLKRASRGEKTTDAIEAILAIPWFPLNRLYRIKR